MKKNSFKKILPILIIIIGAVLINLIKKDEKISDVDPNGNLVFIENKENTQDNSQNNTSTQYIDTENKDINNGQKNYQEMDLENYYEANKGNNTFRIQDVIHNSNGTITIRGRVYRYLDLPSTLSAEEYQSLLDGKSLNILGEKVTKVQDDNIAQEAGYDTALKVETQKYKYDFYYYLNKNEDGTATLYNGSDSSIAEGTNVYLQKTLSGNFECYYYGEKILLKDYYKNDVHIEDLNKTRLLHKNDEFVIDEQDGTFFWLVVVGNQ